MEYIRTIQEFATQGNIIRGIYEGMHKDEAKVLARKGNRFYIISHFIDAPELNEMRDDVSKDFLIQIEKTRKETK